MTKVFLSFGPFSAKDYSDLQAIAQSVAETLCTSRSHTYLRDEGETSIWQCNVCGATLHVEPTKISRSQLTYVHRRHQSA